MRTIWCACQIFFPECFYKTLFSHSSRKSFNVSRRDHLTCAPLPEDDHQSALERTDLTKKWWGKIQTLFFFFLKHSSWLKLGKKGYFFGEATKKTCHLLLSSTIPHIAHCRHCVFVVCVMCTDDDDDNDHAEIIILTIFLWRRKELSLAKVEQKNWTKASTFFKVDTLVAHYLGMAGNVIKRWLLNKKGIKKMLGHLKLLSSYRHFKSGTTSFLLIHPYRLKSWKGSSSEPKNIEVDKSTWRMGDKYENTCPVNEKESIVMSQAKKC